MGNLRRRVPLALWAYLAGTALLVVLGMLPSEITTSYRWQGVVLEIALLGGLFLGSNASRLVLIGIGLAVAFGTLAMQSGSLEFVATLWSVVALLVTGLLLTPSARRFTARQVGARQPADSALQG
jgi:hypothetical protein